MSDIVEMKKRDFRAHRDHYFSQYDILRMNIISGDLNPDTGLPYAPLTEVEKAWRLAMCHFPAQITEYTEASDYPQTPPRVAEM